MMTEVPTLLLLAGIPYRYNRLHTTLGGLSSVCVKLEPASSKNNKVLKINALQKCTPHALYSMLKIRLKNLLQAVK